MFSEEFLKYPHYTDIQQQLCMTNVLLVVHKTHNNTKKFKHNESVFPEWGHEILGLKLSTCNLINLR